MIDHIFADILKEARQRPGKDLVRNVYGVLMDIHLRVLPALEQIRAQERRKENDENNIRNTR